MVGSSSRASSSTGKGRASSEQERGNITTGKKKSTTTRRRGASGSESTAPPPELIPVANTNSDSTAATTTNPSSTSRLSSSSTFSEHHTGPLSSAGDPTVPDEAGMRKAGLKRRGVVHLEELPGSRVGPDDGPWPKEYEILETEEDLWRELRSLARPHRTVFVNYDQPGHRHPSRSHSRGNRSRSKGRSAEGSNGVGVGSGEVDSTPASEPMVPVLAPVEESPVDDTPPVLDVPTMDHPRVLLVDSVNFQPCKTLKTQDRYVVTQLDVHGELWTLTGVFDGHMGDVTVEHVSHHLPIIIREFLKSKLPADFTASEYDPEHISQLFQSAIAAFDDAIAHDILDLFGGSVDQLSQFSDEEIRRVINDNQHGQTMYGHRTGPGQGGENWRKARLCMYGTTALVTLIDPKGEGFWVANLGDCMGILVTRTVTLDEEDEDDSDGDVLPPKYDNPDVGEWTVEVLTEMHNGDNDKELDRIRSEHPGEENTCIKDRRVLGALAPTRCLGDIPFKQPPDFTRRVLYNLYPFVHNTAPWEDFLKHNLTPPYISSQAEVVYRRIKGEGADQVEPPPERKQRRNSGISAVLSRFGSRGRKSKKRSDASRIRKQRFLVLVSDGFLDLCSSSGGVEKVMKTWAKQIVQIGSQRQVIEETKEKIRERANAAEAPVEEEPVRSIAIPVPSAKAPLDMSHVHFAFGDTDSSIIAVSPVSATSPVPFTANSFSSSVGSLSIPNVEAHDETSSGMSTPAYAFSIPPTRAASPSSHHHPSHSPPTSHFASSHSPPQPHPLTPHSPPRAQSTSLLPVQAPAHASPSSLPLNQPQPSQPQSVHTTVTVPRLQRPPLPHTNKSYHCTSTSNMALRLLRCALGGVQGDDERVAKALTVDMDASWLDDTSIVVMGL